jgi:hypothetical protein
VIELGVKRSASHCVLTKLYGLLGSHPGQGHGQAEIRTRYRVFGIELVGPFQYAHGFAWFVAAQEKNPCPQKFLRIVFRLPSRCVSSTVLSTGGGVTHRENSTLGVIVDASAQGKGL